ncbi:hypothetical protein MMC25_003781 [Agyrium rufum]|nr:hypothetical protein [Agyrium rufum]
MTLPQLYANVSLHSFDHIRYVNGRPEGCGGPSPFFQALNTLVTRNVAIYVKTFRLHGSWKDQDLEDCARVGRVPDSSQMLNTLVRVALDRMPALESFSWELNTKILPIVWLGLVQRPNLHTLTVRFPSSRQPQPTICVPPIPKLTSIRVTDIDPLCYPDDISDLLYGSKKLKNIEMHFSPRMRAAREPSVSMHSYFGKSVAKGYKIPIERIAIQNLYGAVDQLMHTLFDETLTDIIMINSTFGTTDAADFGFIETSWTSAPPIPVQKLTCVRGDKISRVFSDILSKFTGMRKYYLVTGRIHKVRQAMTNGDTLTPQSSNASPRNPLSPATPITPANDSTGVWLGDFYLDAICKNHGATLRHLLLMPQWRLSEKQLSLLVNACPHLEQLGIGLERSESNALRLILPKLPKLYALRLLDHLDSPAFSDLALSDITGGTGFTCPEERIGYEVHKWQWKQLRWVGLGDMLYMVGKNVIESKAKEGSPMYLMREVIKSDLDDVEHIEIWALDKLEI